jgi:hypothetical protein
MGCVRGLVGKRSVTEVALAEYVPERPQVPFLSISHTVQQTSHSHTHSLTRAHTHTSLRAKLRCLSLSHTHIHTHTLSLSSFFLHA